MEPSPYVPLAPALASTTPLLGVAALPNADSNSSFVVAVTAAGGGVSIVDGRSQELTRTWMSSSDIVLESAAVWDRSSDEDAGSLRLAILSSTSAATAAPTSTCSSSTTDLLSWPASVPEGSIDAVADRVRLPLRPIALLSGMSRGGSKSASAAAAAAVVAFADGNGRSVRSLLLQRGEGGGGNGGAAAAGSHKRAGAAAAAAFLACLSSDDASVVVSLVGAGVDGLSIRESRVDAAALGGKGGPPPRPPASFPLPAPLPAPAVALASASERRAVVLCSDGTLLAFDLVDGAAAASLAWRHRLAAFSTVGSSAAAAAAPTTPGSKKRGKAGSEASPPPAPALVVADAGRSVVAVFQSSLSTPSDVVVLRAVAVDAALGAPRGVALVELPSSPPSSSSSASAAAISASPPSADSSALVVSFRGTAFVVAEEAFAAPAGVVGAAGGHAGPDLASLVGALAPGAGGGGGARLLAASAAAAAGVAAFDDDDEEGGHGASRVSSSASLPLLVQPAWAAALGKLPNNAEAEAAATAAVAVPIPSLAAAAPAASASSRSPPPAAAAPPPAHFVAAAEALKKMEAALVAASQSKTKASAAVGAAAARSWAEAAAACSSSSSTADDDRASPASQHLPPLPSDLHGRAASAAARLGHWDSVKAALAALPLTHGGSCAGLMPAAAAAGEFEVLATVAASAPDAPPADVAGVISLALSPAGKSLSAARRAWRDTLAAAAEEAVSAAEEAAAAAASSRGGSPGMGPLASALAAEAAAAVAAVSSFGGGGGAGGAGGAGAGEESGELALHALLAAPRDDAALQAALRAVPAGVAPALARYLAAWATALAPLPAVPARQHRPQRQQQQQQQRGSKGHSRQQHLPHHPCGRLPTLCDVAAWASALVDAHLVALASSAAGAGAGAGGAGAKDDDARGTRRSLEALRAVAAEGAADAASLAPLFGAAGHVLCGSPLPSVAVAAAAAYSVEMLDLGVRR